MGNVIVIKSTDTDAPVLKPDRVSITPVFEFIAEKLGWVHRVDVPHTDGVSSAVMINSNNQYVQYMAQSSTPYCNNIRIAVGNLTTNYKYKLGGVVDYTYTLDNARCKSYDAVYLTTNPSATDGEYLEWICIGTDTGFYFGTKEYEKDIWHWNWMGAIDSLVPGDELNMFASVIYVSGAGVSYAETEVARSRAPLTTINLCGEDKVRSTYNIGFIGVTASSTIYSHTELRLKLISTADRRGPLSLNDLSSGLEIIETVLMSTQFRGYVPGLLHINHNRPYDHGKILEVDGKKYMHVYNGELSQLLIQCEGEW